MAAPATALAPANESGPPATDTLPAVRTAVRTFLLGVPAFGELPPAQRRQLAEGMVRICHAAAVLKQEEMAGQQAALGLGGASIEEAAPDARPLAVAQSAAGGFGASADRAVDTTHRVLNAVSFPRFVTDLLNGVFKAMLDSSIAQVQAYVGLVNNVSASVEGFADANVGPDQARSWLVERYPAAFELNTQDGDGGAAAVTVALKDGGTMPTPDALKTDLGLAADESPPSGDPEAMVPFVRRHLAKTRQEVLSTLVMLGLQRIIVDSGRINAAMRFHVDTRSAATEDKGSRFESQTGIHLAAHGTMGLFGASADITENIGYVSTQREQTTEEMNTDLDLSSSVEVTFRGEPVPLDRLATSSQVQAIRANTRNPEAEDRAAAEERRTRLARQDTSEQARRQSLDEALRPSPATRPTPAGQPDATSGAASGAGHGASHAGGTTTGGTPTATGRQAAAPAPAAHPPTPAQSTPPAHPAATPSTSPQAQVAGG